MQKEGNKMQMRQRMKNCDWLIKNRNITGPIKYHNLLVGGMYTQFYPSLHN